MPENRAAAMSEGGEDGVLTSTERANSSFLHLFVPLRGLDNAYPHWEGPRALFSSSVPMLISSGKALTDTSRNTLSTVWVSPSAAKLTHEMNQQTIQGSNLEVCK